MTAIRFYATEQLGPKQSLTPEGFLLCQDVPIARTGTMQYADFELPDLAPDMRGLITVERDETEVFRPETLASFAGKAVTDDHPSADVTPATWQRDARGIVLNPRRGEGALADCIVADMLVTEPTAIEAVRAGKREVSCGYDAHYEQIEPGRARQRNIVGNHVALVDKGRCGPRCAIGDSDRNVTDGVTSMSKRTVWDRLMTAFKAKDEEAFKAELEKAKDEASEEAEEEAKRQKAEDEEAEAAKKRDEEEAAERKDVKDTLARIADRLDALEKRTKDAEAESEEERKKREEKEDKTEDAEGEKEPEEEEEERKGKTGDSAAGLRRAFQAALSRAEILAPGIKLPTHDAAATPKATRDAICGLRRSALETAYATADGKAAIDAMMAGAKPDFSRMTCDAARLVFNAAAEAMRGKRQGVHAGKAQTSLGVDARIGDLTKSFDAFWGKKSA